MFLMIWVWSKVCSLDATTLRAHLNHWLGQLALILVGAAILFHALAGFRHLLMDLGFGELKESGRKSAWIVWEHCSYFDCGWSELMMMKFWQAKGGYINCIYSASQ